MNIDAHGPVGLWLAEHDMIDPLSARLEIMMNKGLQIIVPDFIMPKFEGEPFTENELMAIANRSFWYKKPNLKRFRAIIRKQKQLHDNTRT